jgi:hypothetical protein
MDDQDLKDAQDLFEVAKMMESRGWAVALVSLNADREKIIRIVSGAQTKGEARKHDWEYFQGVLAGFQRVVDIFENLKAKYEELLDISIKEKEDASDAAQVKSRAY